MLQDELIMGIKCAGLSKQGVCFCGVAKEVGGAGLLNEGGDAMLEGEGRGRCGSRRWRDQAQQRG